MSKQKTRQEVLEIVKNQVGVNSDETTIQGRIVFCPMCGDDITTGNDTPGQKDITCWNGECMYKGGRAFIFDQKVLWKFNDGEFNEIPKGELVHFSVGAIIKRGERFLLFRRTLHPVGRYTIPAGHLEKGDDPKVAAIKEAYEETGLGILSCVPILDNVQQEDDCRRSVDYHVWNVYTCESIGDPRMSYEADIMGWYTLNEITNLPLTRPVTKIFELIQRGH